MDAACAGITKPLDTAPSKSIFLMELPPLVFDITWKFYNGNVKNLSRFG
jgi:hypothetical protein